MYDQDEGIDDSEEELDSIVHQRRRQHTSSNSQSLGSSSEEQPNSCGVGEKKKPVTPARKSSLTSRSSRNSNSDSVANSPPKSKKSVGFDLRPRVLYPDEDPEVTNILSSDDIEGSDEDNNLNLNPTNEQNSGSQQQQQQRFYMPQPQYSFQPSVNYGLRPQQQQQPAINNLVYHRIADVSRDRAVQ